MMSAELRTSSTRYEGLGKYLWWMVPGSHSDKGQRNTSIAGGGGGGDRGPWPTLAPNMARLTDSSESLPEWLVGDPGPRISEKGEKQGLTTQSHRTTPQSYTTTLYHSTAGHYTTKPCQESRPQPYTTRTISRTRGLSKRHEPEIQ